MSSERLRYVDAFRGVAILYMIIIQLFDAFSVVSIYSSKPYYVEAINSVTWFPPPVFFAFVTGMSVYLLLRQLPHDHGVISPFMTVTRKYGWYILLSLPFTWFMWGLDRFWGWQEAVQGLALAGIVLAGLYLMLPSLDLLDAWYGRLLAVLGIIIVSGVQATMPHITVGMSPFPTEAVIGWIEIPLNIGMNSLYRGWFSVGNLLPIMLGGTLFLSLCRKQKTQHTIVFGSLMLLLAFGMHATIAPIDYYGRSASLAIFGIGQASLLNGLILYIYRLQPDPGRLRSAVEFVGRNAFLAYILHYIAVIKILEITGMRDTFGTISSWALALCATGAMIVLLKLLKKALEKESYLTD